MKRPPSATRGLTRSARSAAPLAMLMAAVSHSAFAPQASNAHAKPSGAAACATREGADSRPVRRPYPAGPNRASGKVPFAMVSMPFPAPCKTAKPAAAGASRYCEQDGPERMQRRGDAGGDQRVRPTQQHELGNPLGDLRRPDEGGGRHGRGRARAGSAQKRWEMGGHRSAHHPGRREREREQGHRASVARCSSVDGQRSSAARGAFGTTSRFNGKPTTRCMAAHARHAARQLCAFRSTVERGQPTVLANPAISVDAGDRSPRRAPVEAGERRERRVVQAERHAGAQRSPA